MICTEMHEYATSQLEYARSNMQQLFSTIVQTYGASTMLSITIGLGQFAWTLVNRLLICAGLHIFALDSDICVQLCEHQGLVYATMVCMCNHRHKLELHWALSHHPPNLDAVHSSDEQCKTAQRGISITTFVSV